MKCLIAVGVLALVLAAEAKPFSPGMRGMGQEFQRGNQYGNSGFQQGGGGYGQQGFQEGGSSGGYDRGHHEKSFSSIQQGHESSSHDRGGSSQFGSGGGSSGGYNGYTGGMQNYGNEFGRGSLYQ